MIGLRKRGPGRINRTVMMAFDLCLQTYKEERNRRLWLMDGDPHQKKRRLRCTTFIPEDIVADILGRLPVKALQRFKVVCKSWSTLIRDPYFIDLHLQRSKRNHRLLFLPTRMYVLHPYRISLYSYKPGSIIADLLFEQELQVCTAIPVHCDGLIIIPTLDALYACNPCTRELVTLPRCSYSCAKQPDDAGIERVGFGFDPCAKKYKVVHYFYRSFDLQNQSYSMGFEVFTLGTKSWRPVTEDPPCPVMPSTPTTVNGVVYWRVNARIQPYAPRAILCFDLRDDKYRVIPPPPGYWHLITFEQGVILIELKGNLCFASCLPGGRRIKLWMCEEDMNHRWTLSYTFNLLEVPRAMEPFDIHDGRILMRVNDKMGYYDTRTDKWEAVADLENEVFFLNRQKRTVETFTGKERCIYITNYVESLVQLSSFGADD